MQNDNLPLEHNRESLGAGMSNELANWDEKSFVLSRVRGSAHYLQYASERLKDDEEVVLETIKNDGHYIRYASPKLKDHKELALIAIKNKTPLALLFYISRENHTTRPAICVSARGFMYDSYFSLSEIILTDCDFCAGSNSSLFTTSENPSERT